MKIEEEYIPLDASESLCETLLIAMTNEYIDYRNQVYDGCCYQDTMLIDEDTDDYEYLAEMDIKIKHVKEYLGQ